MEASQQTEWKVVLCGVMLRSVFDEDAWHKLLRKEMTTARTMSVGKIKRVRGVPTSRGA